MYMKYKKKTLQSESQYIQCNTNIYTRCGVFDFPSTFYEYNFFKLKLDNYGPPKVNLKHSNQCNAIQDPAIS